MLLILSEDLNGALAAPSADPDEEDCPLWVLDEHAQPKKVCLEPGRLRGRVFLDSFATEVSAPFDLDEMIRSGRRFARIDAAQRKLSEAMRDEVAERLARLVDAGGAGGDFKVLVHSRDWSHSESGVKMTLQLSAVLCGNFLEQGPAGPEHGTMPSPKRIFSKIRDARVAAKISLEMAVRDVMDA